MLLHRSDLNISAILYQMLLVWFFIFQQLSLLQKFCSVRFDKIVSKFRENFRKWKNVTYGYLQKKGEKKNKPLEICRTLCLIYKNNLWALSNLSESGRYAWPDWTAPCHLGSTGPINTCPGRTLRRWTRKAATCAPSASTTPGASRTCSRTSLSWI